MSTVTRRGAIWVILAASFVLLISSARSAALADTSEDSVSIWAGQAYTLNVPPCDRQNNTSCPPSTKVYLQDTYTFIPSQITLANSFIARGQEFRLLLWLTNVDPRGINHTFTIASPAQEPLFALRLDHGVPGNAPQGLHLDIGDRVRVNGGPPLSALVTGPGPGERVINFYCSYHKDKGMTGQLILSPTHFEPPLAKQPSRNGSQPTASLGIMQTTGMIGAAIPLVGLPLIVLYKRRKRGRPGRRR